MISIITTLALTGAAVYYGFDFHRLIYLFIVGMATSFGINWFYRASKRKDFNDIRVSQDEYKTVETYPLRTLIDGDAKYLYYAREEVIEGRRSLVFNCQAKEGPFKDRHVPADIVTFVCDKGCTAHVRLAVAHKWFLGDIWQSIIPCKRYSVKFELHIPA